MHRTIIDEKKRLLKLVNLVVIGQQIHENLDSYVG